MFSKMPIIIIMSVGLGIIAGSVIALIGYGGAFAPAFAGMLIGVVVAISLSLKAKRGPS